MAARLPRVRNISRGGRVKPSISLEMPNAVTIFSIITRNASRSFCAGPERPRSTIASKAGSRVERTMADGCAGEEPIGRIGMKSSVTRPRISRYPART